MSKAQFGLGFHKGKSEGMADGYERAFDIEKQVDFGEIYWVCGELGKRIGLSDDDPLEDMALAKAVIHLLAYRAKLEYEHKQRKTDRGQNAE